MKRAKKFTRRAVALVIIRALVRRANERIVADFLAKSTGKQIVDALAKAMLRNSAC